MGTLQMSGYLKMAAEDSAAATFQAQEGARKAFLELLKGIVDFLFNAD